MVFGNLSTGYWLGAAAAAGLHWVELGRGTLSSTGDTISVGAAAGWTLHSSSSIANGKITCTNTGESYKSYSGLGKPTDFVWDFTFTRNSGDAGNTSSIILSSHNGGYGDPSSGQTNVQFYLANGNVTTLSVRKNSGSGNVQTECTFGVGSSSTNIQPTGTTKYYRIIKDGADFSMKRYGSDSDRTSDSSAEASASATMTSTATSTWNSGSGDLSHIVIDGHASGAKNYSIDDIKFYKDKTTATGTPEINETFSDLTAKPYLLLLASSKSASGESYINWRFNSDTGSNYGYRYNTNGGSDATGTDDRMLSYAPTNDKWQFVTNFVMNNADQEKLCQIETVTGSTAGAGNTPQRREIVGKWANTSDSIIGVQSYNSGSGDYAAGSEVVVLGYDPDDTEGTNVWEELASVDLSGGAAGNLSSGTFAAKKYLMFELVITETGTQTWGLQFNSDTGFQGTQSSYAIRYSGNGTSDGDSGSTWKAIGNYSGFGDPMYVHGFIINKSDEEKLIIAESNEGSSAGAGNAPGRAEWVGKWANTSAQITSINIQKESSSHGDFATNTSMKVWGFD